MALEIALLGGALWYVAKQKGYSSPHEAAIALREAAGNSVPGVKGEQGFPSRQDPQARVFSWEYRGEKYVLEYTLYGSVYAYYQKRPRSFAYFGNLPDDWEEKYYEMFLQRDAADDAIGELADALSAQGKARGLDDDQIVELVLAFVQAIPYDEAKAQDILADASGASISYPYEVLYENKGVCSDKSILGAAILRELGYGSALLAYEQDNHMALGVRCPQQYSTYGSGYCYAETTATGHRIGIIPEIDRTTRRAREVREIASVDSLDNQARTLGDVQLYARTEGKEYRGVILTVQLRAQIEGIAVKISTSSQAIARRKKELEGSFAEIEKERKRMEDFKKEGEIEKYNARVLSYNESVEKYRKDSKELEKMIADHNALVKKYNALLKET